MSMDVMNAFIGAVEKTPPANQSSGKPSSQTNDFGKILSDLGKQVVAIEKSVTSAQNAADVNTGVRILAKSGQAMDVAQAGLSTGLDTTLADIMQKLLALLNEDGEDVDLNALLAQMQKRLNEIAEENGSEVAGSMLMIMAQQFLADATVGGQDNAQVTANLQNALAQAGLTLQADGKEQVPVSKEFVNAVMQALKPEQVAPQQEMEVTYSKVSAETKPAGVQFDEAVRAVKGRLAEGENSTKAPKPDTDIDTLQKQVDTGAHLKNTAVSAPVEIVAAQMEEAPPVAKQLETSILNGLKSGQDQFVLKLKPEGMGELTIKLSRTAEGTIVSIVAKSAETQRMLANEAHLLRDTLRPYKVAVDSILTEQQESLLSQQQSFNQQQRQDWRDWRAPARYKDEPLSASKTDELEQVSIQNNMPIFEGANELDAYI